MSIELNWATFRRLVQLEFAALLLLFPVGILELFIPGYHQLDEAFERQAADYGFREAPAAVALAIFLLFLVAYIWSLLGMLQRKASARSVYLGTHVLGWLLSWVLLRSVHWSHNASEFIATITAMASGAILLLAYSREHGQVWFDASIKD